MSKLKSLKKIENALSRNEMRSISAGLKDSTRCLDWPGCFDDCDCGVYDCSSGTSQFVHCATLPCTNNYGTTSQHRKCSC